MSYSKQITIWCDSCSFWEVVSINTVKAARLELRMRGWSYKKGKDFCPDCTLGMLKKREEDDH